MKIKILICVAFFFSLVCVLGMVLFFLDTLISQPTGNMSTCCDWLWLLLYVLSFSHHLLGFKENIFKILDFVA
jgi:hypothetical protein